MANSFDAKHNTSMHRLLYPYFVLAIFLALTIAVWWFLHTTENEKESAIYSEDTDQIVSAVTMRLDNYKMILQGGAGVFTASDECYSRLAT